MKYISNEIREIISDKSKERHPYIVIIMECNEQGTNLNIESAMTGNPIILKGLLSFLGNAYDEISKKIISKEMNAEDQAKLDHMMNILNEIESLSPEENDKLLIKYFPKGKVSSVSIDTLNKLTKEAEEVLNKLKGNNGNIKFIS
ncbi:MAG TPA: hypothetical protein P5513_06150 [Candidatus Diapherotrites archaeon]|nr:hypothetical protein [Candidatus Diapherotrites archaeon]